MRVKSSSTCVTGPMVTLYATYSPFNRHAALVMLCAKSQYAASMLFGVDMDSAYCDCAQNDRKPLGPSAVPTQDRTYAAQTFDDTVFGHVGEVDPQGVLVAAIGEEGAAGYESDISF